MTRIGNYVLYYDEVAAEWDNGYGWTVEEDGSDVLSRYKTEEEALQAIADGTA